MHCGPLNDAMDLKPPEEDVQNQAQEEQPAEGDQEGEGEQEQVNGEGDEESGDESNEEDPLAGLESRLAKCEIDDAS